MPLPKIRDEQYCLVVDHEAVPRTLVVRALRMDDYEVTEAVDGVDELDDLLAAVRALLPAG
jgi:CheY-like chemotaxis protein